MDGRVFPLLVALACAALPPGALAADAAPAAAASAAQPSWTNARHAFTVQLIQLSPDSVRAFYENMGYPSKAIDAIARVCVFGTSIRNNAKAPITYDVADWKAVTPDGRQHPLITKTQWLQRWKPLGVRSDWSIPVRRPGAVRHSRSRRVRRSGCPVGEGAPRPQARAVRRPAPLGQARARARSGRPQDRDRAGRWR